MDSVLKGYLRLTRPANLPTAVADVFAGAAIAGMFTDVHDLSFLGTDIPMRILPLVVASVCLYAGGVVLNDVFDLKIDKIERPERPIPSGLISLKSAAFFGALLLLLGVLSAFLVNVLCGGIALLLAIAIIVYDSFSKKYPLLGPLNMGVCRGLNLLLGMGIFGGLANWWYALIPVVYIAAITLISRGEVHGNNKKHIILAGILYAVVIFTVIGLMILKKLNMLHAVPFLIFFGILIYRPLFRAFKLNTPGNIKKAVMAGVLSIIVLDASLAVGFSQWWVGLLIVLLLPLSIFLSKLFAVT